MLRSVRSTVVVEARTDPERTSSMEKAENRVPIGKLLLYAVLAGATAAVASVFVQRMLFDEASTAVAGGVAGGIVGVLVPTLLARKTQQAGEQDGAG